MQPRKKKQQNNNPKPSNSPSRAEKVHFQLDQTLIWFTISLHKYTKETAV